MRRAAVRAVALVLLALAAVGSAAADWVWRLPAGMPEPWVPQDNPMSEARRALGERLFFEPKLSVTGGMSCADCHERARAFTDGRSRSPGATGELTERNAMTLVNVAYSPSLGWTRRDPRGLEEQMLDPLFNEHPLEMGLKGHEAAAVAMLAARADYRAQFRAAFPGESPPWTMGNIIKAIATYLRTLIAADSAFDRRLYGGERDAMTAAAIRGQDLFFATEVGCAQCHSGILFAGPWRDAGGVTGDPAFADNGLGAGEFKVPTLRNVALTAPYMHDGRLVDLDAVLAHYGALARTRPVRDARLPRRELTPAERADLRAFLEALTSRSY